MNLPAQSPYWDDVLPLADMLAQAKFFMLEKGSHHGDLARCIMEEFEKSGQKWYRYRSLGHDSCGVTCEADGTMKATLIDYFAGQGQAELTTNSESVLQYIGDVMESRPRAEMTFEEANY